MKDESDYERLRESYKRLKTDSTNFAGKNKEIAELRAKLDTSELNELCLYNDLAISKRARDELQASYDILKHGSRPADEYKALERRIELLQQDTASIVLRSQANLAEIAALKEENKKLKGAMDVLRGETLDAKEDLRLETSQKRALEGKHKDLPKNFENYRKRVLKAANE